MNTARTLGIVATAALALSPALMLSMRGGTGECWYGMFALSLGYLCSAEDREHAAYDPDAARRRTFCIPVLRRKPCRSDSRWLEFA